MRTNIKINTLCEVLNGTKPLNTIVGNSRDQHGTFLVAFVATDEETGKAVWDAEADKVKLNWRRSNRQAQS